MRRVIRGLFAPDVGTALLAMTALACLPLALRREAPDAAFTLLLPATLIGAAGSFMLHGPKRRKLPAAGAFGVAGALLLFARIGQMGEALVAAGRETLRLAVTLLVPSQQAGSILTALDGWIRAQGELWAQISVFAQRAVTWLASIAQGLASDDPPARALWLGLVLWLLAIWAGRRLRLHDDPLGALLPTTMALAVTLDRTVQNRWPLWLHLAALMTLITTTHLARLLRSWRAAHTDYSDSVREDSLLIGFLLIGVILSGAFGASTFSLEDFLDKFRREEPVSSVAGDASGSRRASGGAVHSGAAGLQSVHIITAGPELSQDVVMYVSTGDLPPLPPEAHVAAKHYYWRDETYESYNGRAWSNPRRNDVRLEGGTALMERGAEDQRRMHASVEIPSGVSGAVYWTGTLIGADMPLDVAWRTGTGSDPANPAINGPLNMDLIGALAVEDLMGRQSYTFDALLPEATEAQLQAAPAAYPDWVVQRYVQLPDSVPERVRALARDLTVQGRTPYDRALAIEHYLRQIPYSLDVPAPPSMRDATDYFLFDLKKGYCDYYATAMTVLARASGLPARIVTGYASGSYDSYSATYVVREEDAHSWVEIYFTGIGWVEFEPTAGQPLPERESMRARPAAEPEQRATKPDWYVVPPIGPLDYRTLWRALLLLAGMSCAWLLLDTLRLHRMSPEAATERLYRRLRHATRRIAGMAYAGETAREHAALLTGRLSTLSRGSGTLGRLVEPAKGAINELTNLYMLSLFSPSPLSEEDRASAIASWAALRWRLALLRMVLTIRRPVAPFQTRENGAR